MPCAGLVGEEEVLKLAAEAGLNEKAFAELLQSSDTANLAPSLATVCRCRKPSSAKSIAVAPSAP